MMVGPVKAKLAVIAANLTGEAEPFDSPAGRLFKVAMSEAGINPERAAFGWVEDGMPTSLVDHAFVVLAGNDALASIRPDLNIGWCHGRVMGLTETCEVLAFPMFHPEAFYRNPLWRRLLADELALLREIGVNRPDWTRYAADTCVRCRGEFFRVDDQGVVFCVNHWAQKLHESHTLTPAELARVFETTVTNPKDSS